MQRTTKHDGARSGWRGGRRSRLVASVLAAGLLVGIAAAPADAGDGFFRRLGEKVKEGAGNVREAGSRAARGAQRLGERAREAPSRVRDTIDRTQQRGREIGRSARDLGSAARGSISRAGAATGRAAARCVETMAVPSKRKEFVDRATPIAQELAVAGIKHVPVYDPDTGEVVTLDSYMRSTLDDMGGDAMLGSDLADDPLRTGLMLMMDSDSLDTLRLIQDPGTGEWLSIDEALNRSTVPRAHVTRVRRATEQCRTAYASGSAGATRQAVTELGRALEAAPTSSSAVFTAGSGMSLAQLGPFDAADDAFRGLQGLLCREAELDTSDAAMVSLGILALCAGLPFFVLGRMSKRRNITVVARAEPRERSRRARAGRLAH